MILRYGMTATLVLKYAEDKPAEVWTNHQDSEGHALV